MALVSPTLSRENPGNILILTLEGHIACVKAGSVGSFTGLSKDLKFLAKNHLP